MNEKNDLSASLESLNNIAGQARQNVDGLSAALERNADANSRTSHTFEVSSRRISSQLSKTFSGLITDGDRLNDAMKGLALTIADMTFQAAIKPIANQIGGGIAGAINGILNFSGAGSVAQGKLRTAASGSAGATTTSSSQERFTQVQTDAQGKLRRASAQSGDVAAQARASATVPYVAQAAPPAQTGQATQVHRSERITEKITRILGFAARSSTAGVIQGQAFDAPLATTSAKANSLAQRLAILTQSAITVADPVTRNTNVQGRAVANSSPSDIAESGIHVSNTVRQVAAVSTADAFAKSHVAPFARGGSVGQIVDAPTYANTGASDGGLRHHPRTIGLSGRSAHNQQTAQPVNVVMNISTPDASSFQRSQSQIAAQMGRVLSRGQRNR